MSTSMRMVENCHHFFELLLANNTIASSLEIFSFYYRTTSKKNEFRPQ